MYEKNGVNRRQITSKTTEGFQMQSNKSNYIYIILGVLLLVFIACMLLKKKQA